MSDASKQNNCNGGTDHVANNPNTTENQSGQSNNQANVRYIPITLDYDDKTVKSDINKPTEQSTTNSTNNTKPSNRFQHSNNFSNDPPKPTGIFDRVKHFPVNLKSTQRNESPGRTIPITVHSESTKSHPQAAASPKPSSYDEIDSAAHPSEEKLSADTSAILKIQNIQKEIQSLMDQVENFNGTRKDKNYMYIDEMLTQNLLKLDTIDADGKDKIKQARREAINCVNTCISVLEAKAEAALGNVTTQQQSNDQSQEKATPN
ncbi:BAG domain-containing protein Samui [Pseudolycoriella hygida]|uniref:BAG domain-containing protein Samui n=1 Tax=Pseudolycoriella hygida TaxID=35572 RepID=A0A9Q0RZM7_9DIPT|nr:BAG domain-containing protein Samui [Pseudolycoriella hygida]